MASVARLLLKITGDSDDAQQAVADAKAAVRDFGRAKGKATVDVDTTPGQRALDGITRSLADVGHINATATTDVRIAGAEAQLEQVRARLARFAAQEYSPKVAIGAAAAAAQIDRLEAKLATLRDQTVTVEVNVDRDRILQGLSQVAHNIPGLVLPAAKIAAAGLVAQLAGAGVAGGAALVAGLAPAAGALAAIPTLATTAAQGLNVLKLATSGVKQALGGLNTGLNATAMKKLTPEAQAFARVLQGLKPEVVGLQRTAQAGLFPGVVDGLRSARGALGPLHTIVAATAGVFGDLARRAGALVGSSAFGRDLATVGARNVSIIRVLGGAALNVANALRHVIVAAGPLTSWLARLVAGWAASASKSAEAGRQSGTLAAFFEKTRVVISHLVSIAGSLITVFGNIGHAAAPLGREILTALDGAAASLARLTSSAKGQSALSDYFAQAKPVIFETGRLVRDVVAAFLRLSNLPGAQQLVNQLRTQMLPALEGVVSGTTKAFGPTLIMAITNLVRLFSAFTGSSGPLVLFVRIVGQAAGALATLINKVPGLQALLVALAGGAAVIKALKFGAAVSSLGTLVSAFNSLRGAEDGATAAAIRQRVASAAVTVVWAANTAATRVSAAAQAAWTAVTNGTVLASIRSKIALIASTAATVATTVATTAATAATTAFGVAMAILTSPITLVIGAVAALVGVAILIVKHWETVKAVLTAIWGFLRGAAEAAFGAIKAIAVAGAHAVAAAFNALKAALGAVWAAIRAAAAAAWNAIKAVIGAVATATRTVVVAAFNALKTAVTAVFSALKAAASAAWNAIKTVIGGAANAAKTVAVAAFNALKSAAVAVFNGVKNAAASIFNAVKNVIGTAIHGAVNVVKGAANLFFAAGKAIILALVNGIKAVAMAPINAVKGIIGAVGDLLPGSEPKDPSSPLRGLPRRGRAILENLASGIPDGARALTGALDDALAVPAANLDANLTANLAALLGGSQRAVMPALAGAATGGPQIGTLERHYHIPPAPAASQPDADYLLSQLDARIRDEGGF